MAADTLTRPAERRPRTAGSAAEASPGRGSLVTSLDWLDLLRIVAIGAVVVIHAVSPATRSAGTGWHSPWWWASDLLNSACLWCVPVFVMVSGALLLDPERPLAGPAFLRRRAVRIGIPLMFWIAVYLLFKRQFYGQDLSVGETVKAVASGDPYLQLYFLFIVAGLTMVTPVLRRLIKHLSRRELVFLTAGALGFGVVEHAVRMLGGGGGFNAVTRFLPYVGYYLAGYLLRTARVSARSQRWALGLLVGGWLATAIGSGALAARYGWTHNGFFLYDYLSPTVMVMSLAAFTLARSWRPRRLTSPQLRRYGAATFGVFLIHPLLLFPLLRHLGLPDATDIGRNVALAVPVALAVCLVSGLLALGISRVPVLRRLIS